MNKVRDEISTQKCGGLGCWFEIWFVCALFCDGLGGNVLREEALKMAEKQGRTESGCMAAHSGPTGSSGGKNGPRVRQGQGL